jgi:hypothetical protein
MLSFHLFKEIHLLGIRQYTMLLLGIIVTKTTSSLEIITSLLHLYAYFVYIHYYTYFDRTKYNMASITKKLQNIRFCGCQNYTAL